MRLKNIWKYLARFIFLQTLLTALTIFYYDTFLIINFPDANIYVIENLIEDRDRFLPFIDNEFIKIDIFIAIFIFIFLIALYSTNFYTYVNELTFSNNNKVIDDFVNLYLLWTSSLMIFIVLLRFSVVSRGYLLIYTFIVPLILIIFRNSQSISGLLGRKVTNEYYISFNLKEVSYIQKLKIFTFRKEIQNIELTTFDENKIIQKIDTINKTQEVNLIAVNIKNKKTISKNFEDYLINLNKKILLISKNEISFKNFFIKRVEKIDELFLTYFNNDIQYGSKFIIKRFLDIFVSFLLILFLFPLLLVTFFYILIKDGSPVIIKQNRVGLHGKVFNMYKFRTMKVNSHDLRKKYKNLNKNTGPLFKINNDPRIFKGGLLIRKYSLDELPQIINVLKGDMSLVGPRPLFYEDTKKFDKNYMRRLNVLPGITGLLQINERNTSEFDVWYKYDIEYINNWSIYLDLKIMIKTPFSIFKGKISGI